MDEGLLPKNLARGGIRQQFQVLAEMAGIVQKVITDIFEEMLSGSEEVERLIAASFLDDTTKRNYRQSYQGKIKQFMKSQSKVSKS